MKPKIVKILAIILVYAMSFPSQIMPVMASSIEVVEDNEKSTEFPEESIAEVLENQESDAGILGDYEEETIQEVTQGVTREVSQDIYEETELQSESNIQKESELEIKIEDTDIQTASDFTVVDGVLVNYSGGQDNVVIPGNLGITAIGGKCFEKNYDLKSIVIPEGVKSIHTVVFKSCWSLESVSLPNSLENIEYEAFKYSGLKSLIIPGNVKIIGKNAFESCQNLESLIISNGVIKIDDNAFNFCFRLKSVVIPKSVTTISDYAFQDCEALESIIIPESVTTLGEGVFTRCKQLKTAYVPGGVSYMEPRTFDSCTNLQSVTLGNGLKFVAVNMFLACENLTSVTLPESIIRIGAGAFAGCSGLLSATIPSKVSAIDDGAFSGCSVLKSVKFLGNAPDVPSYSHSGLFDGTPSDLTVYYLSRMTGFTNPWNERNTKVYNADTTKINQFVNRLYEKILNRKASTNEINYYADTLIAGSITGAEAGRNFIFSTEFKNRKLSNTNFIETLYQTFMGRTSDTSGKTYWLNMLNNNVSREYVFKGFVESMEYTNICKSYGITRGSIVLTEARDQNANLTMFVSRCYQKALGRIPEVNGLNYYAIEIQTKRVTPIKAAQNFIFSPEFKNKNLSNTDYIKVLYRTFMGREFDQSGLNYHLNRMKNGTSREEILYGFAYAPEFNKIMSGFGL